MQSLSNFKRASTRRQFRQTMPRWLGTWFALFVIAASNADATLTQPQPWQEAVYRAEFVGVLRCTRPGLTVSEFEVVESWRGPAAGTRILVNASAWLSQSWTGDRVSVALNEFEIRDRPSREVFGWHTIHGEHDYLLWPEPATNWHPSEFVINEHSNWDYLADYLFLNARSFDEARETVRVFLELDTDERQVELIKALAQHSVVRISNPIERTYPEFKEMEVRLATVDSTHQALSAIFDLVSARPATWTDPVLNFARALPMELAQVAADEVAAHQNLPPSFVDKVAYRPKELKEWADSVPTLDITDPAVAMSVVAEPPSGPGEVEGWRQAVACLVHKAPREVAKMLQETRNGEVYIRSPKEPFNLAIYLCRNTPEIRSEISYSLLQSNHDGVRLVGATHAIFSEPASGVAALRKLVDADGMAGAYAASILVCDGHSEYFATALDLFGNETNGRSIVPSNSISYEYLPGWWRILPTLRVAAEHWAQDAGLDSSPPNPFDFEGIQYGRPDTGISDLRDWWEQHASELRPQRLWSRYDED
jgi:hypothetical protein